MSVDPILTSDGRPTIRVERRYPHPIDKVWRAVTAPEHLGQWFPSPVEIDLRPGGSMHFGRFGGEPGASGTIEELDAPRRLAFTWGAERLSFELAPDGDGTKFALPFVRRPLRRPQLRHRMGALPHRPSSAARRRAAATGGPGSGPTRRTGPGVRSRPT